MSNSDPRKSGIGRLIGACLNRDVIVFVLAAIVVVWGVRVAPFGGGNTWFPRDPVAVDAIPNIGENQQIVFTAWPGHSPRDVEDQISYPLTTTLLGVPGVRTVRSYSMFGFSTVYVIFDEQNEFYWTRARLVETLNSLPPDALPDGVSPSLGPDATALGQVFWYTLEGRDADGSPTGGWDPQELRRIQDWTVRYALAATEGVSEVASIGGFVSEYQVDVNPDQLRSFGLSLEQVYDAVRRSNLDVGARTIELNRVEYVVRGVGAIESVDDLRASVVAARDGVPIRIEDVAEVTLGPAPRRGALDKGGAEAVGGVVVARYGENPMAAIENLRETIAEIAPGLPQKTLDDGTVSRVTIVPFYDRSSLIQETLGTLRTALSQEILITILVVLIMVWHLRLSLMIALLLPLAVLICFIAMKLAGVEANVVALSGIAIAIGTMVDMGIVVGENILEHENARKPGTSVADTVHRGASEVGGAVVAAVATTVISFLPVFVMTGAEGKLFRPLAFTKTFALIGAVVVAVVLMPPLARRLLAFRRIRIDAASTPRRKGRWTLGLVAAAVLVLLSTAWTPVGVHRGWLPNLVFVSMVGTVVLGSLIAYQRVYPRVLRWALSHKRLFLTVPVGVTVFGVLVWVGFDGLMGWLPHGVRVSPPVSAIAHAFPGLGREFMPDLDEGAFLFMPTTMPHASIGEALDVVSKQDAAIASLPEVELAVGKIGRVESALDPAPVSMIETIVTYTPEFAIVDGDIARYRVDADSTDWARSLDGDPVIAADGRPYRVHGRYERDSGGGLVPDSRGRPFRLWRPALDPDLNPGRAAWSGIRTPDDIWRAITDAAIIPGTTGAPKLQPIAARVVMLQSGMRAPMGVKIKGPDLETIAAFSLDIERELKRVPGIEPATVFAERIVGKPYLEIHVDREAIARYGLQMATVQRAIAIAVGGETVGRAINGREQTPIRVRYLRGFRDDVDELHEILITTSSGSHIPLGELAEVRYVRGPQTIKGEDGFLLGIVTFDKRADRAEVDVVEEAAAFLGSRIDAGDLSIPAGVSYRFAGSYENQVRAQRTLSIIVPLALALIFLILYLQFGSATTALWVFGGVAVAWAGGFILIWLYGQSWFLDAAVFGQSFRDLFHIQPMNLSVAVWVGFLALFGIATDDGVVMGTYLNQSTRERKPTTVSEARAAVLEAGRRRIRPCMMTTATTLLALLPVLTSTGRGSDIMIPMAIPSFGGMLVAILSTLIVPVLYSATLERGLSR